MVDATSGDVFGYPCPFALLRFGGGDKSPFLDWKISSRCVCNFVISVCKPVCCNGSAFSPPNALRVAPYPPTALNAVLQLVNESTVVTLTREMLNYLVVASREHKTQLCDKITAAAERCGLMPCDTVQ